MTASSNDEHKTKSNYFSSAITSKYVNTIFKSPLHTEWISSLIYDWLDLQPGHVLVDMGCGTGVYSIKILNKMQNKIRVIGVDPSQGMLNVFRTTSDSNSNIEIVCMDAVTFSQSTQYSSYDRIFLKGMTHFLTHEERLIAFEGFYKQLASKNGKLLIISNHHAVEFFPFDERTKSLCQKILSVETLLDELKHAGFKQIQEETFTYEFSPNTVKVEDWIHLMENRLWSIFSEENINQEQMKDLIDHIKKQYESPNNFQTIDKQTLIKCCVE